MTQNETVKKSSFTSEVVREYSSGHVEKLGPAQCTMELRLNADRTRGSIEWISIFQDDSEEYADIGIWIEGGGLVDYDGLFELPVQAVDLLREAGIRVPDEFDSRTYERSPL